MLLQQYSQSAVGKEKKTVVPFIKYTMGRLTWIGLERKQRVRKTGRTDWGAVRRKRARGDVRVDTKMNYEKREKYEVERQIMEDGRRQGMTTATLRGRTLRGNHRGEWSECAQRVCLLASNRKQGLETTQTLMHGQKTDIWLHVHFRHAQNKGTATHSTPFWMTIHRRCTAV